MRLALVALLSVLILAAGTLAEAQETKYWAVVGGVADYQFINDLNYTDDDAINFAAALRNYEDWNQRPDQIELLIDWEASKLGLYEAIERMGAKANADTGDHDVCVFFFSGHGTQMYDDTPGEEVDLYDEAICAWDFRTYWRYTKGGVTDDELGDWLVALLPADAGIICIFDTCFSGGLAKGVKGALPKFYPNRYVPNTAKPRQPVCSGVRTQVIEKLLP